MENKKEYKTSAAQRKAIENYRQKNGNKYATFSVCVTVEEKAEQQKTLKEHNAKPVDVWRRAIELLKRGKLFPDEQDEQKPPQE